MEETGTAATTPIYPLRPAINGQIASGEKGKARDIIAAIRTLQQVEREHRPATEDERQTLARFGGFGAVALSIFPDPVTGHYKDAGWQALGDELKSLLSPEEYDSAKRTTFNAFYTSPTVISAMHDALARLGVPAGATVLEPGCGTGNFMSQAAPGMRFIGVELDSISGRIARALHPNADIRIESFRDTKLPEDRLDAVIGNPPFADVRLDYRGRKLPLHDFFIAKSLDAVKPGGILALVTSHYTLDKLNAATREDLAEKADFLGAIRLPSDAFKREGTSVVTDIVFLRKRANGQTPKHVDADWLATGPLSVDGAEVTVNRYFLNHPEMVLGTWSRKDTLYGSDGYSVAGNGDLATQLDAAIRRLPECAPSPIVALKAEPAPAFTPPPPEKHIAEGSFFIGDDKVIHQVEGGQGQPVTYCGVQLRADGTPNARKIAALIGLRDIARRVLQSQNEGWPEQNRTDARRKLNWAYDRFVAAYGPINKTTFTEAKDGGVIRRMPNTVKFREDPDAMLVMALEEYDEVTGKAAKAPILLRDVVGKSPPVTHVNSAEEGLLVSLDRTGGIDLAYISQLYTKPEDAIIAELGDLIYRDPESKRWQTADDYLSGNVREKLKLAEAAGPAFARNAEALRQVQPEDVLPGDIDAGLGAPWIPASDIQAFAAELFSVAPSSVPVGHLKKDAVWSLDAGHAAEESVAATAEYGTPRANGTWLLDLALNMKTPVIYDTIQGVNGEERVVNQDATLAAREKQKLIKEKFKSWVFAEPERTEKLVRLYNDTYNNLRPRLFDGSHLDFPGMSQGIRLNPGTISRRNVLSGQLFSKFGRSQLEELAETHFGELQPQQAIRCLSLAMAGPEPSQVPVQPLQIQEPLRHLSVPSLLHPRHTVDALHQAAGPPHSAEHRPQSPGRLRPIRTRLGQLDRPGQRPGSGHRRDPLGLPTQPFQIQQRRQHVGGQSQPGQSLADLVQEGEALATYQQSPRLGPDHAAQVRQGRGHDRLRLGSIVEPPLDREELERRLGSFPGRLGRRGLIPEPLGLTPQPVHRRAMTLA